MTPGLDHAYALNQDAEDPLGTMRALFHIPKQLDGRESIYLCGHSLGLQPRTARSMSSRTG